jgi:hypothetical protein
MLKARFQVSGDRAVILGDEREVLRPLAPLAIVLDELDEPLLVGKPEVLRCEPHVVPAVFLA